MKKVINYKVQKEEWETLKNEAFKKLNAKATIDGFRKGKAPRGVFEKNYPGQIVMEAADIAIDKEYKRLIIEEKIMPIIEPNVNITKISDEELEVVYTFILEPEVKLGKYKNLGIKKEEVKVSKEEIQEQIDRLVKNYAELMIKEEGKVENGDITIIDFEGFKDGVPFDGGKGEDFDLEIGSNSFIPGFEEGMIGMSLGETKDLKLTFPNEYHAKDLAGKDVVFKVTVKEIKTKVLPELDKDFFDDLGMEGIYSKEDLEAHFEEELSHEKEHKVENEYINKLLETVRNNTEIDLEDEVIIEEAKSMYEDYMHNMSHYGITEEVYLQYLNTTKEKIVEDMKAEAEKRLKNTYILNAIIKEENIEATHEEAEAEIKKMAEEHGTTEEEVTKAVGGLHNMMHELCVKKVIELMK